MRSFLKELFYLTKPQRWLVVFAIITVTLISIIGG